MSHHRSCTAALVCNVAKRQNEFSYGTLSHTDTHSIFLWWMCSAFQGKYNYFFGDFFPCQFSALSSGTSLISWVFIGVSDCLGDPPHSPCSVVLGSKRTPSTALEGFHNCHSESIVKPGVTSCTLERRTISILSGTYASDPRILWIYIVLITKISQASWYLTLERAHLKLNYFARGSLAAVRGRRLSMCGRPISLNAANNNHNKDVCQRNKRWKRLHSEHLQSALLSSLEFIDY